VRVGHRPHGDIHAGVEQDLLLGFIVAAGAMLTAVVTAGVLAARADPDDRAIVEMRRWIDAVRSCWHVRTARRHHRHRRDRRTASQELICGRRVW
jgi:hypothetical protein